MSPEAPTLAVVIPVFNGADALRAAVASVRAAAGTGAAPEIVVSDDGSTDEMSAVFTELAADGVTVVRQATNQGPAAARNRGAAAATTEWLVFLDSDDELAPDSITALIPSLEAGIGLVRARYANRTSPTEPGPRTFLAGTFAVRRQVFDAAGGYDEELRFSENSELLMRLEPALDSLGLQCRDSELILTLVRSVGQSRNYDDARMLAAIHILDKHADHFAADAHERATYEAIASVNASRTRQWDVARRYAWRALRSEPRNPRHAARFGRSLLGPIRATRGSSAVDSEVASQRMTASEQTPGATRSRLVNSTVRAAQHWLARNRRRRPARWIGNLSVVLSRGYENDNADGTENGEWRILDRLRSVDIGVVFDVGANRGDWTEAVLERFPLATVHTFEIEPTTRRELIQRVGSSERVVVADVGLANEPGELDVWIDREHSDIASTVGRRPGSAQGTTVRCRVDTGDRYCSEHGVDHIDLLKVDVEGADLSVLEGFRQMLTSGRVGAIQFEFTSWAPLARVWLHDFYELLEPLEFTIGKIYPTYVDFRAYEPRQEIFVRANFLAVHQTRADIRECV